MYNSTPGTSVEPPPAQGLIIDFNWLNKHLHDLKEQGDKVLYSMPDLTREHGAYAEFCREHGLHPRERLLIVIALALYLDPLFLNGLQNEQNSYRLVQCNKTGQLLPTGETFLKLLAHDNHYDRIYSHRYLSTGHLFYQKSVIDFGEVSEGMATYFGVLKLTPSYRELFLYNRHSSPRYGHDFPAQQVSTELSLDDVYFNPSTFNRLDEIMAYLEHGETLRYDWDMDKHLKRGYRALFHGPSGTGKTLAAAILGKYSKREVYRVDLSTMVSKYIGETSKNLNALFNHAEDKNWILFFDEGDALFGKRVDTSKADDKNAHYANQDIAFLLQRIEDFNGLVIVATNFRKNMDDAFTRRFQNITHFDILVPELRKKFWEANIPAIAKLGPGIDLAKLAQVHLLSQASIINVINRVCLMTIRKESNVISAADLELCIKDELHK